MRSSTFIGQALQGRRLEELSVEELQTMLADIEVLVRDLSEELVADLGSRDELEFEKELKNNFISLLLSIQSKRRQQNVDGGTPSRRRKGDREMKYLTTVRHCTCTICILHLHNLYFTPAPSVIYTCTIFILHMHHIYSAPPLIVFYTWGDSQISIP